MKKNTKLFLTIQTLAFVVLLSTPTFTHSATPSCGIGSIIDFGQKIYQEMTLKNLKYDTEGSTIVDQEIEYSFNVTSINNVTKMYDYDAFNVGGISPGTMSYDYISYITGLSLSSLFSVDYSWDFEHNETVLVDFHFALDVLILIDPNWTIINNHLADIWNTSTILETVADPYQPILYNFTLGDILADAKSYSIPSFTPTTTQWIFDYDYSGVVKAPLFNSTAGYDNYYSVNEYKIYNEVIYNTGGVLQRFAFSYSYNYILDEMEYTTILRMEFSTIGFSETSNFAYLMVIPAIASVALLTTKFKKKKN